MLDTHFEPFFLGRVWPSSPKDHKGGPRGGFIVPKRGKCFVPLVPADRKVVALGPEHEVDDGSNESSDDGSNDTSDDRLNDNSDESDHESDHEPDYEDEFDDEESYKGLPKPVTLKGAKYCTYEALQVCSLPPLNYFSNVSSVCFQYESFMVPKFFRWCRMPGLVRTVTKTALDIKNTTSALIL